MSARLGNSQSGQASDTVAAGLFVDTPPMDVREFVRKLWRRRRLLLLGTALGFAGALGLSQMLTPRYVAKAELGVALPGGRILNASAPLNLADDTEAVQSEALVLRSRDLAIDVVDRLGLERDPEFAVRSGVTGTSARWIRHLVGLADERWADVAGNALKEPTGSAVRRRSLAVDEFLTRLNVSVQGRSRVVNVTFASSDPEKAARVVNTLTAAYLARQVAAEAASYRRESTLLTEQAVKLRVQMIKAQVAVEKFREQLNVAEGRGRGDPGVSSQEVSERMSQLVIAQTRRADAEAKLRQLENMSAAPSGVGAAGDVLQSPVIQKLEVEHAALETRAAELSATYGTNHPKMIEARKQIDQIRGSIQREVGKVVASVRNSVKIAAAQEEAERKDLHRLKDELVQSKRASVDLNALESEAHASEDLYRTFLDRAKQASAQEALQHPTAEIISRASPPIEPAFPRKKLLAALGLTLGCVVGGALGLGLEHLHPGLRSREELAQVLGANVLGLVPLVRSPKRDRSKVALKALDKRKSAFVEAYRTIFTRVVLATPSAPKIILVCSAVAREGKTTVALSLSITAARSNKRIVLVDCDLHRPATHECLGASSSPGLTDFLVGTAGLDDVLHEMSPGMWLVPAGSHTDDSAALLSSVRMQTLLRSLRNQFDFVMVDTAPILAVSDALVLLGSADRVIMVVRWATTPRDVALTAVEEIRRCGGDVVGGVLSMVDFDGDLAYGLVDTRIYSRLKHYYLDHRPVS